MRKEIGQSVHDRVDFCVLDRRPNSADMVTGGAFVISQKGGNSGGRRSIEYKRAEPPGYG